MRRADENEQIFHIFLPHTLIQVLQVKLVQDKKIIKPLSAGKLMFIGAVVGLSKERGYCWAGNKKISKLIVAPVSTIEGYITQLENDKILYRYYDVLTKERRLRVHDDLIFAYPELAKDLKIVASKTEKSEENNHHGIRGDHHGIRGDHHGIRGDHHGIRGNPYYIYKYNEIQIKRKENSFIF